MKEWAPWIQYIGYFLWNFIKSYFQLLFLSGISINWFFNVLIFVCMCVAELTLSANSRISRISRISRTLEWTFVGLPSCALLLFSSLLKSYFITRVKFYGLSVTSVTLISVTLQPSGYERENWRRLGPWVARLAQVAVQLHSSVVSTMLYHIVPLCTALYHFTVRIHWSLTRRHIIKLTKLRKEQVLS